MFAFALIAYSSNCILRAKKEWRQCIVWASLPQSGLSLLYSEFSEVCNSLFVIYSIAIKLKQFHFCNNVFFSFFLFWFSSFFKFVCFILSNSRKGLRWLLLVCMSACDLVCCICCFFILLISTVPWYWPDHVQALKLVFI